MKLSPKNLLNSRDTFQYQIYAKGNSFLLQDSELMGLSNEEMGNEILNSSNVAALVKNEMEKINSTEIIEKLDGITDSGPSKGVPNIINTLVKELNSFSLEKINKKSTSSNMMNFKKVDFQESLIQIKDSRWQALSYRLKPEILFLGDPISEGVFGTELDLNNEYFNLLMRIVLATKIPTEKFGFITHILETDSDLQSSNSLASLIDAVRPKFLITLGANAFRFMTNSRSRLSSVHGKINEIELAVEGDQFNLKVLPTFHPDYILINPKIKKTVWEDFQILMASFK